MTYVFEHIVVMTFPGVSKDAWPVEFDLPVVTPLSSCTVKFLESLDNHISHADQEQALREGMLKAETYQDKDFKNLVAEIQARRPPEAGYAVITVRGPAELGKAEN